MSVYVKTIKTADTNGYVLPLPRAAARAWRSAPSPAKCWIEPLLNQTETPATPTNALIASVAGVASAKSTIKLTAAARVSWMLCRLASIDSATARLTHVRILGRVGGLRQILGS